MTDLLDKVAVNSSPNADEEWAKLRFPPRGNELEVDTWVVRTNAAQEILKKFIELDTTYRFDPTNLKMFLRLDTPNANRFVNAYCQRDYQDKSRCLEGFERVTAVLPMLLFPRHLCWK